ncbi:type I restriction endonuclease subunit R [Arcticibacterium luteifluviistationis]|uniref:type I site-specific deoxyribonuclease n=1 Tax=Arcticibacterium luteifluviistationis TaxID=1784714 RepID=A0A2Z4GB85_9BACT|nr:DEAD/DEAH box helicase family protein [Arcticibacterium luteifluviistationis]AWV98486.1 restriction endonuclease subunit R [Arcticibacterium luteifluviistationis]
MKFNEDSRVKIPTILHLIRLGYTYLSLSNQKWDESTNIFTDIFFQRIAKLNPELNDAELKRVYDEVSLSLENEDLGKAFFEKLTANSGTKFFDFDDLDNNDYHVVTELTYKKDDDEFRPDIILLINGMPLFFIEVKKPNNLDGILAEQKRINTRFQNKKFRKFVNITQLMVFSNNMGYDDTTPQTIQGAFYASASYKKPVLNYFREEETFDLELLLNKEDTDKEIEVLKDTNLISIKNSQEFITNKNPDSATNRICTSLFQRERLAFILKYGFAYVKEYKGLEKHVMRYPQIFATKAIEAKLNEGIRKGIIWHTQGSGKTALAYYNVHYMTAYFQKKGIIPKFYFIVDRLDLMIQAGKEFISRGLVVHNVNSREEFSREIKSKSVIHNDSGKAEITVVNIQKFQDDPDVIRNTDYQLNIQRIYFLDEVHRSYNPKGSFLANLNESDPNAIKIGLTGTPLLGDDYNSKSLFGGYIHKYYYNASIKDGYTLRLIREEIETTYKLTLQKALEEIEVLKGKSSKEEVFAHPKFVEPMLDYIVTDFEKARVAMGDDTIGGMVVCDSSKQAKMMYEIFQEKYALDEIIPLVAEGTMSYSIAAEPAPSYNAKRKQSRKVKSAAVILYDVEERKALIEDFKDGKIDFLFVYNMLLTGFDAKRLKKLYVGRVVRSHNLLQMLTRVNRRYENFRYGYIVDFADIQKEFDKTNQDYFNELQSELGDEMQHYSNIFKSPDEIDQEINEIKDVLFHFDTLNAAVFSQQVSEINERGEMLKITRVLNNAKSLYNLIRLSGNYDMLDKLDFNKLTVLSREANNRLALINTKEALDKNLDTTNLLNVALEDVIFAFTKVKEEEMVLADALRNTLQKTREALGGNFDQADPVFISLKEELERLFRKKNLSEVTKEEMESNIKELESIYKVARELERKNQLLKAKYQNDEKYTRLHKRLMEKNPLTDSESKLFEALQDLKTEVDTHILKNSKMLENESFVEKMMVRLVIDQLKNKHKIPLDAAASKRINGMIVKEYMNEFYGRVA